MALKPFETTGRKQLGYYLTQSEGLVLGVAAKMFAIAGPVLVYGYSASIIAGLVSLLFAGGA